MRKRHTIWIVLLLSVSVSRVWAQETPSGDASGQTDQPQQPVAAYGQESAPAPVSDNPPLSGLDTPSLEPNAAPLSYLQPGVTVSETADSNVGALIGHGSFSSVTRGLGSIALRRLWSHYDLALDYIGGGAYYARGRHGARLLQEMEIYQKINWKRGSLSLRDSFKYLPEGSFGGSYGSLGSANVGSISSTPFGAFFGGTSLGSLGLASRIANVSVADLSESLSPKSSLTATGGYAFTHFFDKDISTGSPFIGVTQLSAQGGYNRILSSHTQLALVYGYQSFDYSIAGMGFHSHVIQAMYGRRISGRMDLLIAAGPQITVVDSQSAACSDPSIAVPFCQLFGGTVTPITNKSKRLGAAGRVRLRYRFPKTAVGLSYQRYETSGSGFFAGAQSDIADLTASRPLSRVWEGFVDAGYSRHSRLQQLSAAELGTCAYQGQANPGNLPLCPGVNANTYSYAFGGFGVHRAFGHDFRGFASYQYNYMTFDNTYCAGQATCNRISNRQVITFGLDWTPRPIRLD